MSSKAVWAKCLGMAAWLLVPLPALAQPYTPPGRPEISRAPSAPYGYGSEVALGGGVMNFAGAAARSLTNVGGSWDLRLALGTRSVFGVEAAYVGSAQKISAAGLDTNANLLGNGAEANLRLNAPMISRNALFEPFGLVGVGWTHFNVVNSAHNTSVVRDRDDVVTVPLGFGLAASSGGFMVDARFTYRFTYNDQLLGNADMGNWVVSANVGREF